MIGKKCLKDIEKNANMWPYYVTQNQLKSGSFSVS